MNYYLCIGKNGESRVCPASYQQRGGLDIRCGWAVEMWRIWPGQRDMRSAPEFTASLLNANAGQAGNAPIFIFSGDKTVKG
jgi:hypothetical protein